MRPWKHGFRTTQIMAGLFSVGVVVGTKAQAFADADFNTASGIFTLATEHKFNTGDRVRLTTTGTVPSIFALATDYYVIRLSKFKYKLAANFANAYADTPLTGGTAAGGGAHTMTVREELDGMDRLAMRVEVPSVGTYRFSTIDSARNPSYVKMFTDALSYGVNCTPKSDDRVAREKLKTDSYFEVEVMDMAGATAEGYFNILAVGSQSPNRTA